MIGIVCGSVIVIMKAALDVEKLMRLRCLGPVESCKCYGFLSVKIHF